MKAIHRKQVLFFCLLITTVLNMNAQFPGAEGPGPEPPVSAVTNDNETDEICRMQTDWMKKKLKLNRTQLEQADKINLEYVKKVLQLKKQGNPLPPDKKNRLDNERDEALRQLLSEKQFRNFEKKKSVLDNSFQYSGTSTGTPPPPPF